MKNVLLCGFGILSVCLLGYIGYDKFLAKEEDTRCECKCINDNVDNKVEDSSNEPVKTNTKLELLDFNKKNVINVKLNGKNLDLKLMDDSQLYINDKLVEKYASYVYVTDYYIITGGLGQLGFNFTSIIDENSNKIDLSNNNVLGEFQAHNMVAKKDGTIVAIGYDWCGLECTQEYKIIEFSVSDGQLLVEKNDTIRIGHQY